MTPTVLSPCDTYTKSDFIELIDTISDAVHAGNCYKQKPNETLDAFLDRIETNV